MWPLVIMVGIGALLVKAFSSDKSDQPLKRKKIFISFAIEDEAYRNHLIKQARDEKSPFDFVDMSVKQPWNENEWKKRCRTKIKRCDGVIVMLSNHTFHSSGVRWEIKCAEEEGVPIVGMHIRKNDQRAVPPELAGKKIITWTWKNLENSINKF